jgi:FAD:protein FMN transferase
VLHTLYGETMGTRWRVDLFAAPSAPLVAWHAALQAELDAVVAQMSDWEPDSDISRFNRAPAGSWQVFPEAAFEVLACALHVAAASDGAYDPTVAPLVALWGFGAHGQADTVPAAAAIRQARARVGWQRLQVRAPARQVRQPGDCSLDLSAIAKGFAVDAVAARLKRAGVAAALVDVGGELRAFGRKPDATPWRVLVEAPGDDAGDSPPPCVLVLEDAAAATSGDHWHHVVDRDGRRLAHTIDPRSGHPVPDAPAAVTVVAGTAMEADAWATALTVMGAADGLAFARRHAMAVRFLLRTTAGTEALATPHFEAMQIAARVIGGSLPASRPVEASAR